MSDKVEHTGNPCTVCGYENIPEHEHSLEYHAAKPVTCTENGNIEYWECSGCRKYFSDEQGETEITDKNSVIIVTEGHKWGEWETVKQATCTEEGKKERICSRCSHSETKTIPVKAHTYDGYIKNSEYHWQKCSVCQNESEREPHNFVDGVCSVCNYDSRYSWELDFTLTGDYYTVTGIGDCTDKEIKIPESYEGKSVKAIAANAFWGQTGIASLNIPKSIESIGNNAFQNCTGLEEISIENKDIELGAGAFLGCEKITWASLPAFVVSEIAVTNLKILFVTDGELENAVLTDAKNLVSLTVPDITTTLGAVFEANTDVLESLTLTETTEIAENAFKDFTALKEINLPEGINSIGADAFSNTAYYNDSSNWVFNVLYLDSYLLKANTQITGHYPINNETTVIADAAFISCNGLTSIVISDNVKTIGNNAFENCSGLTNVSIPDSVMSIGSDAFSGCSNLIKIETDAENPNYFSQDGILYSRKNTEFVHIPADLQGDVTIADGIISIFDNAFSGRSGLTSVIIPDSVTSIGSSAFEGCSGLISITIPCVGEKADGSGETHFGYIFGASSDSYNDDYVPKNLKEVIITGGTSIGSSAFEGCSGLISITIPNGVTSIGDSAFRGCSSLIRIIIPDSVTSIGSYAFYNCSGLTSITIPESVTSIGDSAFYGCSGLTSIIVETGNAKYHSSGNCLIETGTKTLILGCQNSIIPNDGSVTSIGDYAFRGCSGLTSVTIPESITSIGGYAFYGCSGLTSITIPYVGKKADGSGETHFGYIFGASSDSYNDDYVPKNLKEVIITGGTSIGGSAFRGCSSLISIIIPDSVTSIGDYAFYGCSGLMSITIPESVTSIGNSAFSGCRGLTSATIGNGITSIGFSAFGGCSELTSITIPFVGGKADGSGETHFGYIFGASSDSYNDDYVPKNLKEVIITGGTSIENFAFSGCSGLMSITIPESVTSIGNSAFYGCSGLTSIIVETGNAKYHSSGNCLIETGTKTLILGCQNSIIPNDGSVTSIGDYAFRGCSGLTSVTIPESITSIGGYAFYGCSGLTSITIPYVGKKADGSGETHFGYIFGASSDSYNDDYVPKNLKEVIITGGTSIGGSAFRGCSSLISIIIPDSVTSIGDYAFSGCSGLTSVTIPESVTSIGDSAFYGCSRLTSITIPDSVTSIENFAFSGCSGLTNITIGNSVTSIGNYAFSGCSGLTSITIPDSVTSIGNYAFSGCSGLTIYCEAESKPYGWFSYWNSDNRPVIWGYKNQ